MADLRRWAKNMVRVQKTILLAVILGWALPVRASLDDLPFVFSSESSGWCETVEECDPEIGVLRSSTLKHPDRKWTLMVAQLQSSGDADIALHEGEIFVFRYVLRPEAKVQRTRSIRSGWHLMRISTAPVLESERAGEIALIAIGGNTWVVVAVGTQADRAAMRDMIDGISGKTAQQATTGNAGKESLPTAEPETRRP